ncbi:MAG: O-antigen ligase family protein [Janthinobacterium lividum]
MVGLLATRAVVALSPVAGLLAALANPELPRAWRNYFHTGAALRAATLYLLLLVSGLYTSNIAGWQHELFRLLPWLVVPFAFVVAVPLNQGQRYAVGSLFVVGAAGIGLATLVAYHLPGRGTVPNFALNQSVSSITRVFHIPFGVMLALAVCWGYLLSQQVALSRWARWGLLAAAAAAALTLHLLAYRTGLVALYAALAAETLYQLLARRRLRTGLALLAGLLLTLAVAKQLKPIQDRLNATQWDVEQYENGQNLNDLSVSRRLAAWQTAWVIITQNPWLGVGPADVDAAMLAQYDWRDYGLRQKNRAMTHNQYVHYLTGGGLLGLSLWLAVLLWPLVQPRQRQNPYLRQFVLIMGVAMLVDSLLELQISYNLFVFGYGFLVVAGERKSISLV